MHEYIYLHFKIVLHFEANMCDILVSEIYTQDLHMNTHRKVEIKDNFFKLTLLESTGTTY
jgi:hypothetical protein